MPNIILELDEWYDQLLSFHIPRWEELPEFEVYMDQVIHLVNRYIGIFHEEENRIITPSMINNYVKLKLIPKPIKKKYNREHIAYLIAITLLKQVLTIQEVKEGIEYQTHMNGLKGAYNLFCNEIENMFVSLIPKIEAGSQRKVIALPDQNEAIQLAALSFCSQLLAKKIVYLQSKNLIGKEVL